MPVGKKTTASVRCTAKAQEPRIPGPSSHFQAVEHLQAGYRLLIAVQPFDDVVAGYTTHDCDQKGCNKIKHALTPFPLPDWA